MKFHQDMAQERWLEINIDTWASLGDEAELERCGYTMNFSAECITKIPELKSQIAFEEANSHNLGKLMPHPWYPHLSGSEQSSSPCFNGCMHLFGVSPPSSVTKRWAHILVQRINTKNGVSLMAYSEGYPHRCAGMTVDNMVTVKQYVDELHEDCVAWWACWEHMLNVSIEAVK